MSEPHPMPAETTTRCPRLPGGEPERAIQTWADIGALESIPVRGARVVKTRAGCIAVFRTSASEVYAIDDGCPHKAGPLSQGIVHDKAVTCPLHNWVISLESGKAQGADVGQVRTYALKVEKGRILLDVSSLDRTSTT